MNISDEAVGAAWRAALVNDSLRSLWRNADPEWRESYKSTLRAALTAAAPFIAAQAWEEGEHAGMRFESPKNPYRSEQ